MNGLAGVVSRPAIAGLPLIALLTAAPAAVGAADPAAPAPVRAEDPAAPPLVITRATLWTAQALVRDQEVIVRGGKVAAVGASGALSRPAGARVVDARGDTLLPGLIDAHVHLSFAAGLPASLTEKPREALAVAARQLLRSGVTSGRIHLWGLGDGPAFARESNGDRFPSPRLQFAGPGFFGGRPESDSERGNVWGVKSVDDAARKVGRVQEAGGEWIALHELARFQPGELEALLAEARRLGMRVLVGGDRVSEVERAVDLGVDSIEYLDLAETPAYPESLIAKLRAAGPRVFLVPMVGFPHRYIEYLDGRMKLDDPRLTEFLAKDAAAFVASSLREGRVKPGPNAPKWTSVPPTLSGKFRQLRDAGLQLVVGTDCGSPGHSHADAIWWELETWRKLGVPPGEAVRAATTTAAALVRRTDVGVLEPGSRGDFVLYRGDIESGSFSVERVRFVGKGGVVFVDEGKWVGP